MGFRRANGLKHYENDERYAYSWQEVCHFVPTYAHYEIVYGFAVILHVMALLPFPKQQTSYGLGGINQIYEQAMERRFPT